MARPNPILISNLLDGGQLLPTDLIPIQRGTTFYKTTIGGDPVTLFASEAITAGQALAIKADGTVVPAISNNIATSSFIGFAREDAAIGDPIILYSTYATVTQTLTLGTYYFVSQTVAGEITSVIPPSGNYLIPVGVAVATNIIQTIRQYPTIIS